MYHTLRLQHHQDLAVLSWKVAEILLQCQGLRGCIGCGVGIGAGVDDLNRHIVFFF